MIKSAGILLYRINNNEVEVFLAHPGGPFWAKKDLQSWSIPKGEFDDEDPLDAAKREFEEEIGQKITGDFIPLTPLKQKGSKTIYAFAVKGDVDAEKIVSNCFEMEWPPRTGKKQQFPEIDKAAWFSVDEARKKINVRQVNLLDQLLEVLNRK